LILLTSMRATQDSRAAAMPATMCVTRAPAFLSMETSTYVIQIVTWKEFAMRSHCRAALLATVARPSSIRMGCLQRWMPIADFRGMCAGLTQRCRRLARETLFGHVPRLKDFGCKSSRWSTEGQAMDRNSEGEMTGALERKRPSSGPGGRLRSDLCSDPREQKRWVVTEQ
jgi:hypothetical protein